MEKANYTTENRNDFKFRLNTMVLYMQTMDKGSLPVEYKDRKSKILSLAKSLNFISLVIS